MKKKQAVGILIISEDTGNLFLLQRSAAAGHSHLWSLLSGGLETGENVLTALGREITEEISINPNIIQFYFVNKEITPKNDFFYYIGLTKSEFKPKLDFENEDWGWFSSDKLPRPLYPGLTQKINDFKKIVE